MITILRMAGRRLLTLPPLLLGITLFVFVVLRFSPADPAYNALGEGASDAARAAYASQHGLDDPIVVRYFAFLGDLLHGDLGVTSPPSKPVADAIFTALPLTLQLTFLGMLFASLGALLLGVVAALFRDRWPDRIIRVLSMAGVATPSFWLGILLIQQFALRLGWFPTGGYVNPADGVGAWLQSLFLPAVAIAVPVGASLTRIVRTSMVEELDRDYVRTAAGNGLPPLLIVGRNVLRNALVTPLTVLGLRAGYALGGAVVIETIFGLPGLGTLILNGVTSGDVAVVQGTVLVIAVVFVAVNLVVDLACLFANPRTREA
ncbi:ABC transporter permease [Streptomyces sp. SID3343]|uniref:ABC transporter permease n=1 Tax=Streptomyces sp. SID3343 TaxID=2690260 RepID=UPI00136C3C96|nr:ABC transporter permease [Streptomyces sp. SID3343]MYW04886.1 ABC transporter permease subunit [Streptomyces sp. SID3343]